MSPRRPISPFPPGRTADHPGGVPAKPRNPGHRFVLLAPRAVMVVAALCLVIQFLIDSGSENMLCAFICFTAGSALLAIHFRPERIAPFPISGMMATLPTLITLLLPLVFTTMEGKPVTANLQEPITTFGVAALCATVLVITHALYRSAHFIHLWQQGLREKVLVPLRCFQAPGAVQLWIMGAVGMVVLVVVFVVLPSRGLEREGALLKFLEAFMPYAYAPFILIMPRLYSQEAKTNPVHLLFLIGYFLGLLVFAIAGNYRFAFAIAMMMPFLCYILGLITSRLAPPRAAGPVLVVVSCVGLAGFIFASNLALAMQIARINRGEVDGAEMIRITMNTFSDSAAIKELKQQLYDEEFVDSTYSEYYIANPLISRFVLIKFHDNGHFFRKQMGPGQQAAFRDFLKKRLLSMIPGPLLKAMGAGFEKEEVLTMSFGDWFLMNASDVRHTGFRTGSYQAGGLLAFGWKFYFILAGLAVIIFSLMDSFARWDIRAGLRRPVVASISPIGLIFIYSLVFFADRESLSDWVGYIFRFYPQTIAFYVLLFWGTAMFSGGDRRQA